MPLRACAAQLLTANRIKTDHKCIFSLLRRSKLTLIRII